MKPLTVIGFLGSTLDASKFGPSRWNKWRPSRRPDACTRICASTASCCFTARATSGSPNMSREDIASVSPETDGRAAAARFRRPLGFRGGLRQAARFRPRRSVRSGGRGLSGPHHHRHPRRPDLPVPADRGALSARPPAPDPAGAGHGQRGGHLDDDRPRSVALRQHRHPLRRRAAREQAPSSNRASRPATPPSTG